MSTCVAESKEAMVAPQSANQHFGRAWLALTGAMALHVADEAWNDFLSFYNPLVSSMRERLGFFPLPTFEFRGWLTGLIVGIVFLLLLTPFARRGARWLVPFAYFFALLMVANAFGHMAGSLYFGELVPGVYSSPLLLAAAVYLFWALGRRRATRF